MNRPTVGAEIARGLAARDVGNYKLAEAYFNAAITLEPENPLPLLHLANLNFRLTRYALALRQANQALGMTSSTGNRSFGLQIRALSLMLLKLRGKAVEAARDAVANDPENASNHRVYAQTLWAQRKTAAAEAEFKIALDMAPDLVSTLLTYARFLRARSRLKEAAQVIERAGQIAPEDVEVLITRGKIAFQRNQIQLARDFALWALSRNATNREAIQLLAEIKSRQSWLTRPFWLGTAFIGRSRYLSLIAIGILAAAAAIVSALLPENVQMLLPPADTVKTAVFIFIFAYAGLCIAHVGFLVRRDLKKVKLRQDF